MSGMSKMLKNLIKKIVNFLLMFKVGGVNSPQFQFLTTFVHVYGQQMDMYTDFLLCAIQQQT